jgi:hypothetical protein
MTFGTHITGDSNLWTPYFIFPEYSILSGFKLLPHFGGRYLATMSSEDAISKTTSPIMAVVEPSERLNEAGDPVSEEVTAANERSNEVDEEAQRASEAANSVSEGERTSQVIEATIPPDESCEQENEVLIKTEQEQQLLRSRNPKSLLISSGRHSFCDQLQSFSSSAHL